MSRRMDWDKARLATLMQRRGVRQVFQETGPPSKSGKSQIASGQLKSTG